MDNRNEMREFLASRRAKVPPDQAGLPRFGGQRRVPGLRRGEVAMLAGVSSEVLVDPVSRGRNPEHSRRGSREVTANNSVALLRTEAGRNHYDQGLTDLVGQLSTRSEEFRNRWAAHNVHLHRTGVKHFQHPVVGRLDLDFESLELTTDSGLTLIACSADAGMDSQDSLRLLASWAATSENAPVAPGRPAG